MASAAVMCPPEYLLCISSDFSSTQAETTGSARAQAEREIHSKYSGGHITAAEAIYVLGAGRDVKRW